jgi:hypothetical protein
MKRSVLGLTLAISVLFTVPAGARGGGGFPVMGPSYPYPSYCEQCFGGWQTPPPPRVIVRHPRHRTGVNSK